MKTTVLVMLALLLLTAARFNPATDITVLTRENGSGTKSAFLSLIGVKEENENIDVKNGVEEVIFEVLDNIHAIGYESMPYIPRSVKILKVDGVEATVDNIVNGRYKIARPLSIVYRPSVLNTPVNVAFYNFLQSHNTQTVISNNGYVSLVEHAPEYKVDSSLSGSITISGSTSVELLMRDLASIFQRIQPNVRVTVEGGGSGAGYNNANSAKSVFGMISEDFDKSKASLCDVKILCKDAIVLIVNRKNKIDNIAMSNIINLYGTSRNIDNWSSLVK